jgi:hypothetical protein
VFVDSSGIKAILRLTETACPHGIVLRLPRDDVLRVLDILSVEGARGIRVERRPSGDPSWEGPERSASRNIPSSTARSVRSSSQPISSSAKACVIGVPKYEPIASARALVRDTSFGATLEAAPPPSALYGVQDQDRHNLVVPANGDPSL